MAGIMAAVEVDVAASLSYSGKSVPLADEIGNPAGSTSTPFLEDLRRRAIDSKTKRGNVALSITPKTAGNRVDNVRT